MKVAFTDTLSALANPTRRELFEVLVRGPATVGELAEGVPVSQPAVSQHLAVLREAGLVRATRDGARRVYRAEPAGLEALRSWVEGMWSSALAGFSRAAEAESRAAAREGATDP